MPLAETVKPLRSTPAFAMMMTRRQRICGCETPISPLPRQLQRVPLLLLLELRPLLD